MEQPAVVGGVFLALVAATLVLACESPSGLGSTPCESPGEFGSAGCAELFVAIEEPDFALAPPYMLTLSARWMGGGAAGHHAGPRFGFNEFRIGLPPVTTVSGDTATVWVVARVISATSGPSGETVVQAADSVRHLLEIAPPGTPPPVAAIRLRPR